MRKFLFMLASVIMMLTFTSCGGDSEDEEIKTPFKVAILGTWIYNGAEDVTLTFNSDGTFRWLDTVSDIVTISDKKGMYETTEEPSVRFKLEGESNWSYWYKTSYQDFPNTGCYMVLTGLEYQDFSGNYKKKQ